MSFGIPVRNGVMLGLTASTALTTRGGFPVPALLLNFLSGTLDSRITFTRALDTATRVNSSGFIETVNANIPRFDYDPVTLQPRGLLIEEARTNLLLYSAQLDTAPWENSTSGTGVAATVTANAGVAPDGTSTADRLQFSLGGGTTTGDLTRRRQPYNTPAGAHTFSVYLRSTDGVSSYNMHITDAAGATNNITVTGNWRRFIVTATSVGTLIYYSVGLRGGQPLVNSNTADILAWGAQVEAGAFATSYIPTVASTVTRNADAASMTGTNFNRWYNPIEGTLVASGSFLAIGNNTAAYRNALVGLSDGTSANAIQFGKSVAGLTTDRPATFSSNGNFSQSIAGVTITASSIVTMALGLKANSVFFAANGVAGVEDTSSSVPIADQLGIGNFGAAGLNALLNGHIRTFTYFNTRLPNDRVLALSR